MAMVKGAFSKLLKPKHLKHVKYALGYQITPELLYDDLYTDPFKLKGKMKRKIKKLKVDTTHTIEINGGEVSLNGNEFYVAAIRTTNKEDVKQLIQALNMILKLAK